MKLNQYPEAIANAARLVQFLNNQINELRQQMAFLEYTAERLVSELSQAKALTNDSDRRLKRLELLDTSEYQTLTQQLFTLEKAKFEAAIELELLNNQFAVAKIEARREIAEIATTEAARDLIGVRS